MNANISRRQLLKETVVIAGAAAAMRAAGAAESTTAPAGPFPTIRLGKLQVSRLILGSNPFFGFAHGPGADEMKAYYTDERIMAVMDEAAKLGVTAVAAPPYPRWLALWKGYRDRGGKLAHWLAQPDPDPRRMAAAIDAAAKGGAAAIFVQGGRVDNAFQAGKFDLLTGWLKRIHGHGVPAGLAAHLPDAHPEFERRKLPADFYFQCFYQFEAGKERWLAEYRDQAVATIAKIDKPVVAYKILAAGRLPTKQAFAFAFAHLRTKDGVCVGVFPPRKQDMIQEDTALTLSLTANPPTTKRSPGRPK